MKFVTEFEKGGWTMTALCAAFGISRKTGYKILDRFAEEGPEGLKDRSRAPGSHPNGTSRDLRKKILGLRKKRPSWGSKKILARLEKEHPDVRWPVRSTIDAILKRAGLVEPRRRRRRATPTGEPLARGDHPNQVWRTDFKGHFRVGTGERCDPLTATDGSSRYALVCRALSCPKLEEVQAHFERTFREYGLPEFILSDNGTPFASTGIGGLSRLSVWWVRLGITPIRIQPGKPQENGSHERFHLTLAQETAQPPKDSLVAQDRAFQRFRRDYNEERPHEALGMQTPGELYEPSQRPYPRKLPEHEYPADLEVRKVRQNGSFKWRGRSVFLGEALKGEHIGLDPTDDGLWRIFLGPLELGLFQEDSAVVLPRPLQHRKV